VQTDDPAETPNKLVRTSLTFTLNFDFKNFVIVSHEFTKIGRNHSGTTSFDMQLRYFWLQDIHPKAGCARGSIINHAPVIIGSPLASGREPQSMCFTQFRLKGLSA
jgi:hypothetical protein